MRMPEVAAQPDLWSLVTGTPWIDPEALLAAIDREATKGGGHDFRTRLLLRDALAALRKRWGGERLDARLSGAGRSLAERLSEEPLGEAGFPTLEMRMADPTRAETILEFLRELGSRISASTSMTIGGSGALILAGLLSRRTDDVDAVDEVPTPIRNNHELLHQLAARYGLSLAHFQSHYLPAGWQSRTRSLDHFGKLDVFLVDPLDIFVGKLFSKREKDLDDLRMLKPSFDKTAIDQRLRGSAQSLLGDSILRPDAERNWYVLFGEPLPQ